ncbi:unnamed protein product [Gemmataceae bacterium]|nr:unnamed protein product [Gemmataceae bacterium]VTT98872.1 unnamed protein product [Gemmataceae bacterium]
MRRTTRSRLDAIQRGIDKLKAKRAAERREVAAAAANAPPAVPDGDHKRGCRCVVCDPQNTAGFLRHKLPVCKPAPHSRACGYCERCAAAWGQLQALRAKYKLK